MAYNTVLTRLEQGQLHTVSVRIIGRRVKIISSYVDASQIFGHVWFVNNDSFVSVVLYRTKTNMILAVPCSAFNTDEELTEFISLTRYGIPIKLSDMLVMVNI